MAPENEPRTRDPDIALKALQILVNSGIPFAVLHNERQIAKGDIPSDIDLICDVPFDEFIPQIARPFRTSGIRPILAWHYDTGATTLFVTNADASRGAQLDILWDTTGLGKYGLDLRRLMSSVEPGAVFPRVCPLHELLYIVRKRQVKEQWGECQLALYRLSGVPEAISEVHHAFVGSVRDEVRRLIEGELVPVRPRIRRTTAEAHRILGRVRRPAGAWVEVIGYRQPEKKAQAIADRFGTLLPHVGCGRRPRGLDGGSRWLAREVAPVRWRAGIYASWTAREARPAADLQLRAEEAFDDSILRVVDWMEQRVLR